MAATTIPARRIIFGLMTFGPTARTPSMPEFVRCLDQFQHRGYNEVDTARVYADGAQEAWTADAGWQKRGLKLATKVYPNPPGTHKPKILVQTFEKSLETLKTDKVDIFYLHAADRTVPFAETLEAVNEQYKKGRFTQLGLSNYTAFEVAEIVTLCQARGWVRPTIYQGMYNCITRGIEPELVPACRRYGLDIVVYNPLGGGLLTGRYKDTSVPDEGRFAGDAGSIGHQYRLRYFQDATFEAIKLIQAVAEKHNLTMTEVALRWLVHHSALNVKADQGGNDGIVIGASSCAQLEQNLADLEKGELPTEVVEVLDAAWLRRKAAASPYWHGEVKYTYDTKKALFGEGK